MSETRELRQIKVGQRITRSWEDIPVCGVGEVHALD